MAQTEYANLYLPSRLDKVPVDETLADNFQKIDEHLSEMGTFKRKHDRREGKIYVVTDSTDVAGDGSADDAPGIQAILDIAKATDRRIKVIFPAGKYRLDSTIIVYSNTHLQLDPNAIMLRNHNENLLQNTPTGDTTATGYNGNKNIVIEGGIWDFNGPAFNGGTCFAIGHSMNFILKGTTILDCIDGHGIELNSTNKALIADNKFLGFTDTGGRSYSEAIQIDLAKPSNAGATASDVMPWFGSWDNTPCKNVIIRNNYIGTSAKSGSWGRGIGSHSATIGRFHENILIEGNILDGCKEWGIRAYSWSSVVIKGNILRDCGGGIAIDPPSSSDLNDRRDVNFVDTGKSQDCRSFVIVGNEIKGGGTFSDGVQIGGEATGNIKEITFSGNLLQSINNDGLRITFADEVAITGNTFKTITGGTAITTTEADGVVVSGNVLNTISGNGITAITNCRNWSITGNQLTSIGNRGIFLSSTFANGTIQGNTITDVGTGTSDSQHIRLTSTVERVAVIGNTCVGANANTSKAIYLSSTCKYCSIIGNIVQGVAGTITVDTGATGIVNVNNVA